VKIRTGGHHEPDARVARALQALQDRGLDAALLSSPHNVCYVSGYAVPIETGVDDPDQQFYENFSCGASAITPAIAVPRSIG